MANTYADYIGDGSNTDFAITFDYIKTSHVVVEVNEGQGAGGLNKWVPKTLGAGADYTVVTSPTKKVVFNSPPGNNVRVRVLRDSDASTGIVDFENGSVLTETELDNSYTHNRYLAEEAEEGITGGSLVKNTDGQFDADGLRLENLADPDSDDDAVNKGYADNRYVDADGDTMRGALTLSADPINNLHAATKQYTDTKVSKAGDTMSGDLNMGSNKITDLSDPVNPQEAATKAYVDAGGVGIATENYVNQQISNTITGSSVESSKYTFTGNGSDTAFTLSPGIDLDGDTMYDVFIDGICQEPTEAYVINAASNTISFTGTPPNGSRIVIVQRGYAVPVSDKITTNDIEDDAITFAKLQNIASGNVIGRNIRNPADIGDPEEIPILDEDDMATDSDQSLATQQSIKAYVDNSVAGAATDLGNTPTAANVLITSSTGADTTINAAVASTNNTGGSAGVMTNTDKEKLDGIATGANDYSHPDHTGDVTSAGDGATTIANGAVTAAKISSTDNTFKVDTGSVVINEGGADVDFRVEGNTDANLLLCDAGNDRVVIGGTTPTEAAKFAVLGNGSAIVASIENANQGSGLSVLVIKGPNPIMQLEDTVGPGNSTYNVGVDNNTFYLSDETGTSLRAVSIRTVGSNSVLNLPNIPTSSAGLTSGDVWRNGSVLNIVP